MELCPKRTAAENGFTASMTGHPPIRAMVSMATSSRTSLISTTTASSTRTPATGCLLYFGMGRGGYNYYALDVTDKEDPKFLWRNGRDSEMIGLAQTWSTPIITRVNVASSGQDSSKLVMIVGGGYDVTQDNVPYNVDNIGNRIFMVDAITGDLLWHAGPTNVSGLGYDSTANFTHAKLTHSIPADIRVVDMTNDGFADRMYAVDTGGQVWRFDIYNGNTAANLVTGGVFASLGNADQGSHPLLRRAASTMLLTSRS